MIKSILVAVVAVGAICTSAHAQFDEGKFWLGPSVGLTGFESSLSYSLSGEYALTKNIGIGAQVIYGGYSQDVGTSIPGVTLPTIDNTLFGALLIGTYHISPGEQLDPYGKIGLGYFNWSTSMSGTSSPLLASSGQTSGFGYLVQAGARYHFNESIAANAAVGYPIIASLGVDINFSGDGKSSGNAKDDWKDKYAIYIGPYVAGKLTIKTAVAEGTKTGMVFNNPDFGASLMIPFGIDSRLGFGLDIGVSNYGYQLKPEKAPTDTTTLEERYSYIGVFPHINLGGFIVGVNFGFAQSGEAKSLSGDTASVVGKFTVNPSNNNVVYSPDNFRSSDYDPSQYLASMMEVRLGGVITVLNSRAGKLNVNIMAGYTLSGLFNDHRNYVGAYDIEESQTGGGITRTLTPNSTLNPNLVSVSLGLSYLFRLGF